MTRWRRAACAVVGDGGWGTALAVYLHRIGHRVRWWGAFPAYLRELDQRRENRKYLPGVPIPQGLRILPDLEQALADAELVFVAVPSQHLRGVVRRIAGLQAGRRRAMVVSVAKGLEQQTLKRMSQVIREELGATQPLAVLSGPTIASEVARRRPASVVVASGSREVAERVQGLCVSSQLRIYTCGDVSGVELGGALKNPIAIAAGVCDGLALGSNAKAALITRGVVEMSRLGVALGARERTFWGLSGLGDLVTTCFNGRNRWLGEQLGRGRSLRQVLASTPMVIEGVDTSTAAVALARRHGVELPIIEQVHAVLFRGRSPQRALRDLMLRSGKPEAAS